jgi:hypothetical protein
MTMIFPVLDVPRDGSKDEGYRCVEKVLGRLWNERNHNALPRERVQKL